jgi:hypothetical protein
MVSHSFTLGFHTQLNTTRRSPTIVHDVQSTGEHAHTSPPLHTVVAWVSRAFLCLKSVDVGVIEFERAMQWRP